MKFYEREFFVSRIASGLLKYEKDGLLLYMHPLTSLQVYESQEIFKQTYEQALSEGIMTEEEGLLMLVEHGLWTDEEQDIMNGIEKDMEKLKIEIYQAYFKSSLRDAARDLLQKATKKYTELYEKRHFYDYVNCQGLSTFARWNWIIENSVKYADGRPYDWGEISTQDFLAHYQSSALDEGQYRELARNEPWRTIWNAGRKAGRLFDRPATELTTEQKSLMAWSGLYDNIQESTEAPTDEIIEDDDALDGWLLIQKQNTDRDKTKSLADELAGTKNMEADEVIVFGDAKKINTLNTAESNWTKKQRMKQMEAASERGEEGVRYDRFDDMVQRKTIEQNQSI